MKPLHIAVLAAVLLSSTAASGAAQQPATAVSAIMENPLASFRPAAVSRAVLEERDQLGPPPQRQQGMPSVLLLCILVVGMIGLLIKWL